jgi:hypothetical protein
VDLEGLLSLDTTVVLPAANSVVALAKQLQTSLIAALRKLREHVQQGARQVLERVMNAEIEFFPGQDAEAKNKRNSRLELFVALSVKTEEGDPISVWATRDVNGARYAIDEPSLVPESWTRPLQQWVRHHLRGGEEETVLTANAAMSLWEDFDVPFRQSASSLRLVNWSGWPVVEFRDAHDEVYYWLADVGVDSLNGDEVFAAKQRCQCLFRRHGVQIAVLVPMDREVFITNAHFSVRVVRKMSRQVIEIAYR